MSKLAEFRAAEKALAEQIAHLESLKNDDKLQKEIEFEKKLKKLMEAYGKSLRDLILILDPQALSAAPSRADRGAKTRRRERAIKVYRNPHSGEVVETKGGNHKVLKAWKTEYGADVIDSWLQK
ncbi:H-NS family protein MvaT [Pseudomonas delhiensis]|uniref:H-NS family protein MvaT n=1 Tax=Pseudomonas delhiensis TaxID=366289 RepID=A0A239LVT0_9PSED|nr:histone-like nucleoid-structuring protein, MvaT/MvaU family [Pseudomonas delhiensis]SDI26483.1 H-NS family protein MvaT [Pseudomonas delhiensis]SNT34072.1 H-NS family protein MvaT [Pseudomonas delhiensis]